MPETATRRSLSLRDAWIRLGGGALLLVFSLLQLLRIDASHDTLRAWVIDETIVWYLIAFVGFAIVVAVLERLDMPWHWLLAVGLLLRLALLFTEPSLSDDVYRYLWEGQLVTDGISPYSFAINDPAAVAIDSDVRAMVNNQSLASPYLPFAHLLFGLVDWLLPAQAWSMQLVMVLFDTVAAGAILALLRVAELPDRRVLLYWLNPLAVVEVGHGAHIDAVILALSAWGIWLAIGPRRTTWLGFYAGPVLLAAAALTRPLAVLFVPVLYWLWSWRQRVTWAVAFALPIVISGLFTSFGLTQASAGRGGFGSARAYADTFRFNSGIYHWFETWVGGRGLDDRGWNEPRSLTQLIVTVVVFAILAGFFFAGSREHTRRGDLRLLALPLVMYVLLAPVMHPWYLLTLLGFVPFLAPGDDEPLSRWLVPAPWLILSALVFCSYLTYENPQAFAEREWVRKLEWWPTLFAALLALGWWASRRFTVVRRN